MMMPQPHLIQQFPPGMVYAMPAGEPVRRVERTPTIAQRRAMLTAELAGLPPRSSKRERLLTLLRELTLAELRGGR